jgi:hypothetical protein
VGWIITTLLKRLVADFSKWRPGFEPGSAQVGFMVDKVVLGQFFSEYFGFPCQSSFRQILQIFGEVVGLELGRLSLVGKTEELLEWRSSDSGLENRD